MEKLLQDRDRQEEIEKMRKLNNAKNKAVPKKPEKAKQPKEGAIAKRNQTTKTVCCNEQTVSDTKFVPIQQRYDDQLSVILLHKYMSENNSH